MWITKRTDYATRVMLVLTVADATGLPLTLNDLSARTATPRSVIEQVMPQLRNSGLVRSERGPAGGYWLNRDPHEITLEQVVRIFEGSLAPLACAAHQDAEPCVMGVGCALREVWQEARDATERILSSVTMVDLAARSGGPWETPLTIQPHV